MSSNPRLIPRRRPVPQIAEKPPVFGGFQKID